MLKIDERTNFCTEGSECLDVAATEGRWDLQGIRQIDGQRNKLILKRPGRGGHCHLPRAAIVVAGASGGTRRQKMAQNSLPLPEVWAG